MQLLLDTTTTDYAAWKRAFDDEAENLRNAGLTVLQIWRDADDPARVTCLLEVNDRGRAAAWLAKETAFGHAARGRFVETV
jgi:hypothetical protein